MILKHALITTFVFFNTMIDLCLFCIMPHYLRGAGLLRDTTKQPNRRADDTNMLPSPFPVDFLLLLLTSPKPRAPSTSRCLPLCYLRVWPSCSCGSTRKVTLCTHRHCLPPHHHQPHTHTHRTYVRKHSHNAPSVPGPVNNILNVKAL